MKLPVWFRTLVVASVLLGVFFRFYHLDRKTFWEDELYGTIHMMGYTESDIVDRAPSFKNAGDVQAYFRLPQAGSPTQDSLANTVRALAVEDAQHPPLYYVLGHLWVEAFGPSAGAIRALSAIIGVLVIPAAFWLCLELFQSEAIAWTAAALVALSPFDVLYAQEAREYSLWSVALLVIGAAFLRACRLGTPASWALYTFYVVVGLYVYPFTLFVLLGCGLYVVANAALRTRRQLISFALSAAAALALFAPWLSLIVRDIVRSRGVPRGMTGIMLHSHLPAKTTALIFLRNVRGMFLDFGRFSFAHHSSTALNAVLTFVIAALVAYALFFVWRTNPKRVFFFIALVLFVPAIPLLGHDLIFGGILVDQSRYFTPTYIGIELAIAALLATAAASRPARRAWAPVLVLLIAGEALSCGISSQADTWSNKDYEVSRDVAAVINEAKSPLVVSYETSRTLGLSYYLAPSVPLRVRLKCDTCNTPANAHADLLAHTAPFDHVFLLGPTPSDENASHAGDSADSRFRYIDVSVSPPNPSPLGMFLSL
jgi:uncharacterized membrane protein